MRLCDYLIRLTREYTDGGMDSRTVLQVFYPAWKRDVSSCISIKFLENVRSAVRVFTGEVGVTFSKY